jgi:hypothetical protein
VRDRQPTKQPLSARGERDHDLPTIGSVRRPAHEPARFATIDQLDGAVVAELESFCEHADRRSEAERQAPHGEEQLMLTGLDSNLRRRLLAEADEAAKPIAEFRERTVLGG